ncbi:MAG: aldo/keto reductase [Anaerolineae bacterium]
MLPDSAYTQLAGMPICRLVNGMWQLSGAHGSIDPQRALANMQDYHASGFVTWDLADHYGPAELLIGRFRQSGVPDGRLRAFTKWVPRPGPMPRRAVEAAIDRSRERMATDTLDMLQFHWWDYTDDRYLDALRHMVTLVQEGKIAHLGLTNFDTEHVRIITQAGIPVVSNQVQYSLVDMRPAAQMAPYCQSQSIGLLTYGTLCGGLLTDRYLNQPEPGPAALNTASLHKYKTMIDAWGGWALFQELLTTLRSIADRHAVTIANVATRAILDQPAVSAVIIGARLGLSDNREENARVFSFALTEEDHARIRAVQSRSRDLMALIGDSGDEYRRR